MCACAETVFASAAGMHFAAAFELASASAADKRSAVDMHSAADMRSAADTHSAADMRSAAAAVEYHYAQTSALAGNTSIAAAQLVDEMHILPAVQHVKAHHSPFPACPPRVSAEPSSAFLSILLRSSEQEDPFFQRHV